MDLLFPWLSRTFPVSFQLNQGLESHQPLTLPAELSTCPSAAQRGWQCRGTQGRQISVLFHLNGFDFIILGDLTSQQIPLIRHRWEKWDSTIQGKTLGCDYFGVRSQHSTIFLSLGKYLFDTALPKVQLQPSARTQHINLPIPLPASASSGSVILNTLWQFWVKKASITFGNDPLPQAQLHSCWLWKFLVRRRGLGGGGCLGMLHKPILLHLAVPVALGGNRPSWAHQGDNLIINRAGFCGFTAISLLLEPVKPGNMEFCPCWRTTGSSALCWAEKQVPVAEVTSEFCLCQ